MLAKPRVYLGTDQRGRGQERCDVLVGLPKLPKVGGPCSPASSVGCGERDGLSDTWSTAPFLVPSHGQVVVKMKIVGDLQPVGLDPAEVIWKGRLL
jgi:hypothetical protein